MGLFSIRPIVTAYYQTLLEESNSKSKVWLVFFAFPNVFSIALVYIGILVTSDLIISLVSMLAILVGFSINAMFLLVDSTSEDSDCKEKMTHSKDKADLYAGARKITHYSIIFGIISLLYIGLTLSIIESGLLPNSWFYKGILTFITFFIFFHYIFTLLLLPARLYVVVEQGY